MTPPKLTEVQPISAVARWKLTEPVRLYLYGVGSIVLVGLALAGVLTGEWLDYGLTALGVVLAVGTGTEAARASVYSPAGLIRELRADAAHRQIAAAMGIEAA